MGSKKSSRKLHFLRVVQCAPRVALCCELRCGSVGHIMWCFRCGHGWLGEKVENTGVSTADWVQRLYTRQLSGLYFIAESWMEPHLAYWVIQWDTALLRASALLKYGKTRRIIYKAKEILARALTVEYYGTQESVDVIPKLRNGTLFWGCRHLHQLENCTSTQATKLASRTYRWTLNECASSQYDISGRQNIAK